MIRVEQFSYGADNLGYVLYAGGEAVAIDPGSPEEIFLFLKENNLKLIRILNTHSHYDHTSGNRHLSTKTGVRVTKNDEIIKAGSFSLAKKVVKVIPTPGHTEDSVCFYADKFVITGDTLFIANVGNCPTSQLHIFRESLDKLLALPDSTVVYPGHDYTERSLRRAESIEPDNAEIKRFRAEYNPPPIVSTIGDEKKINPYLRAHYPAVKEHLKQHGKKVDTEFECFKSFMGLY